MLINHLEETLHRKPADAMASVFAVEGWISPCMLVFLVEDCLW